MEVCKPYEELIRCRDIAVCLLRSVSSGRSNSGRKRMEPVERRRRGRRGSEKKEKKIKGKKKERKQEKQKKMRMTKAKEQEKAGGAIVYNSLSPYCFLVISFSSIPTSTHAH